MIARLRDAKKISEFTACQWFDETLQYNCDVLAGSGPNDFVDGADQAFLEAVSLGVTVDATIAAAIPDALAQNARSDDELAALLRQRPKPRRDRQDISRRIG
jgi:hypothetical protein